MSPRTLDRLRGTPSVPDEADAIDPRIRERRDSVQRDTDRSRLGKLMIVLALLAAVAGSVAALRSPLLDVDHVVVAGTHHTTPQAVVAASGVRPGVSMGDVALRASSRQVASLPWVRRATVRRQWPGTVRITVTERHPLAQIRRAGGGWLLVDRTGRLLAPLRSRRAGLVELGGGRSASRALGRWLDARWDDPLRVAGSMPTDLSHEVAAVRLDGHSTGLRLRDAMVVTLGDAAALEAKWEALRTLLAQPDRHCFASINLRVATAPALTRRPGCA